MLNAAAEEAELDAEFDDQAQVVVRQRFEGHHEALHITRAAALGRIRQRADALLGEELADAQHVLAVRFDGLARVERERRIAEQRPQPIAQLGVRGVENGLEPLDVERRLGVCRVVGRCGAGAQQVGHQLRSVNVERLLNVRKRAPGFVGEPIACRLRHGNAQLRQRASPGHGRLLGALSQRSDPPEVRGGVGRGLWVEMTRQPLFFIGIDPVDIANGAAELLDLGGREHAIRPSHVQERKERVGARRLGERRHGERRSGEGSDSNFGANSLFLTAGRGARGRASPTLRPRPRFRFPRHPPRSRDSSTSSRSRHRNR